MNLPVGEHYATQKIQAICDQVRAKVEEMTCRKLVEFSAYIYREQKIADDIKYQIKVFVGGTEYFHVIILQTVSEEGQKITLKEVEQNHKKDDVIIPANSD